MVKIRLFRTGTNKRPTYRIVAVDSRRKRQGRVLQQLGTYDPRGGGNFTLNAPALERWVGKGAQLSPTLQTLVRRQAAEKGGASAEASS